MTKDTQAAKEEQSIREIEEELRKEKLKKIWKKYSKYIIYSIIIIVIAILLSISYFFYKEKQNKKFSEILNNAIVTMDLDKKSAIQDLEKIYYSKSAPHNIKLLASMRYANALFKNNQINDSISIYLEVNKNTKYDQYIREIAGLYALKTMVDTNNKEFESKIIDLILDLESSTQYLKYFIVEQKGIFEWSRGNYKIAYDIFDNLLKNPEASNQLKYRAEQMKIVISKNL